jgi:hypothetical protein
MKDLLDWNPDMRPCANQALQNEYFSMQVSSPKDAPTTAITESADKNRSLKVVTASSGYWHPDPFDHQSPPPMAVERQPLGKKRPRYEDTTLVHSGFSACDYEGGYWPDNARFAVED